MATAGRKPKPTEQKRRTGNPGKRALPDKATLRPVPAMDASSLELTPLQAMERAHRAAAHWLAESDAPTVALARDALEMYAELRANPQAKPADVVAAGKWVQSLFGDLGFTPSERSRLGLAEVKAASKMEELRARRNAAVADEGAATG